MREVSHERCTDDWWRDAFADRGRAYSDCRSGPVCGWRTAGYAEHQRQKKSLEKLSKKLHKVEKQKHEVALSQISKIKTSFFPNRILQERYNNFVPYYLKYGDNFIKKLKEELNPLDTNFVVLSL